MPDLGYDRVALVCGECGQGWLKPATVREFWTYAHRLLTSSWWDCDCGGRLKVKG